VNISHLLRIEPIGKGGILIERGVISKKLEEDQGESGEAVDWSENIGERSPAPVKKLNEIRQSGIKFRNQHKQGLQNEAREGDERAIKGVRTPKIHKEGSVEPENSEPMERKLVMRYETRGEDGKREAPT